MNEKRYFLKETGRPETYEEKNKPRAEEEHSSENLREPYLYTYSQSLISNYTSFMARKALGSSETLDWNSVNNVNTLQIALQESFKKDTANEEDKSKKSSTPEDPLKQAEEFFGGMWTSLKNGFVNSGKQIVQGIQDVGTGIANAWDEAGDFLERTGNWVAGDGFLTGQERADLLAQYEKLKNSPYLLAGDSPEVVGQAARYERARAEKLAEIEDILGMTVEASTSSVGNFFDRLGNLLTFNGWQTDASIEMQKIATGESNKIVVMEDGSRIQLNENGGITLTNEYGFSMNLRGTEDFNRLLGGATENAKYSSFGNIDNSGGLNELLGSNVRDYYSNKTFTGGNVDASNEYGSSQFSSQISRQTGSSDMSVTGMECAGTSALNLYKNLGLIRPDMTREEFEVTYTTIHNKNNEETDGYLIPDLFNDSLRGLNSRSYTMNMNDYLGVAQGLQNTDWSILTGMNDKNLSLVEFNTSQAVCDALDSGYIVRAAQDEYTVNGRTWASHYTTITGYSNYGYTVNDPIGPTIYEDLNMSGFSRYWTINAH